MTRALWDDDRDAFLVKLMLDQARAGKRADSGFKKEAWVTATDLFNAEFSVTLTVLQIKTRMQTVSTSTMLHLLY